MLKFASSQTLVIHCFAEPSTLDVLRAPDGAMVFRVAPGELVCVSAPTLRTTAAASLADQLHSKDPYALSLDRSDAWTVFTLTGPERIDAFARLSTIPLSLPPAFLQGAIGGVPGKAIVLNDRIHVMVSSVLSHHLRQRILEACRDLGPYETPPVTFKIVEVQVNV